MGEGCFVPVFLVFLITGVIFVNGFTDAPGAITGVVVTRTVSYRAAVALAALCILLGILVMAIISASVANTMIELTGATSAPALAAAMLSVIIFAVGAWYFGIPTSESHALIAALAASSFALTGEFGMSGWDKVLTGLALSLVMAMLTGYLLQRALGGTLAKFSLDKAQILGAAASAFMHGAQDGQKFIAVIMLASVGGAASYAPAVFLCAVAMAAGTAMGGRRIIRNIGIKMVAMDKAQTVCSDIGSSLVLLSASLAGIPMSTTHAKTSAIMGAGLGSGDRVNLRVMGGMFTAWAVTFPVCGALGYILTRLFLAVFARL
jgi:PiT family inorganic phosphate transporter